MKYKRKFLVQGETVKKHFFMEHCGKDCPQSTWIKGRTRCWGLGSIDPPYTECAQRDKMFNEYIVSETEDGEWQCNCKAWTTHKPRQDCKHIRRAKADPKKYEIDPEWTGKTTQIMKKVLS